MGKIDFARANNNNWNNNKIDKCWAIIIYTCNVKDIRALLSRVVWLVEFMRILTQPMDHNWKNTNAPMTSILNSIGNICKLVLTWTTTVAKRYVVTSKIILMETFDWNAQSTKSKILRENMSLKKIHFSEQNRH